MKPTKAEVQTYLAKLDTFIACLTKADAELKTARSDAEQFEQTVARFDESDEYQDDVKIGQMTLMTSKLALCRRAITRREEKVAEAMDGRMKILTEGGYKAGAVLAEIADRRFQTVLASLLLFSADRASAEAQARRTDICQSAQAAVCYFSQFSSSQTSQDSPKVALARAREIKDVLGESLKSAPNLMRFLDARFQPASAAETTPAAEAS